VDDFPYLPTPVCFVAVTNPPNEDFPRMLAPGQNRGAGPPAPAQPPPSEEEEDDERVALRNTEGAERTAEWRDYFAATLTEEQIKIVDRLSELGFDRRLVITQLFLVEGDERIAREALEKILRQMK
jgi:hypothetical protein